MGKDPLQVPQKPPALVGGFDDECEHDELRELTG